jgi:hypothetical protein
LSGPGARARITDAKKKVIKTSAGIIFIPFDLKLLKKLVIFYHINQDLKLKIFSLHLKIYEIAFFSSELSFVFLSMVQI